MSYVEATFIQRIKYRRLSGRDGIIRLRRQIRPARFPPSKWNMYHRTVNRRDRTNNAVESRHRQMAKMMGPHPGLHSFADKLRRQELANRTRIEQLTAGAPKVEVGLITFSSVGRSIILVSAYGRTATSMIPSKLPRLFDRTV